MSSSSSSNVSSDPPIKALEGKRSFIFTGGKNSLYSCNGCHKDITTQFRACCAICDNYDMCSDCFAAGVQRFPHKNTHAYRVVDCLDTPLFVKDWSINEELMLLEGSYSIYRIAYGSGCEHSPTDPCCLCARLTSQPFFTNPHINPNLTYLYLSLTLSRIHSFSLSL
jgi:hypothetical protein